MSKAQEAVYWAFVALMWVFATANDVASAIGHVLFGSEDDENPRHKN